MEIINENKVSLPELPAKATAKERLGFEVARRIVEVMNMNSPDSYFKAYFTVRHHGDQLKSCVIYVAEGVPGQPFHYKSGSKVVEAVLHELSKVNKVDSVTVYVAHNVVGGKFAL